MLKIFSPVWSPFDFLDFFGSICQARKTESTNKHASGAGGRRNSLPDLFCHEVLRPDLARDKEKKSHCLRNQDRKFSGADALPSGMLAQGTIVRGQKIDLVRTSWEAFLKVVGSDEIEDLLWMDGHQYICDKIIRLYLQLPSIFQSKQHLEYHLAMVYVYFKRTRLPLKEYTARNFLCLLHLAHCMDEDTDFKDDILSYAVMGKQNQDTMPKFLANRDRLLEMMNHRAYVSFRTCNEVMELAPNHPIWQRERYAIVGEVASFHRNEYGVKNSSSVVEE